MLTSDLLVYHVEGQDILPRYLKVDSPRYVQLASELITLFQECHGKSRGALIEALENYDGEGTDFRTQRGLARLLIDERSQFSVRGVLSPPDLRRRLFQAATEAYPVVLQPDLIYRTTKDLLIAQVATDLQVSPEQLLAEMYADLPENHLLTTFDPPTPEWLLNRYNFALAQSLLSLSREIILTIYKSTPARAKQIFHYLKTYGLLYTATGDPDSGYEVVLEGPAGLSRLSHRYASSLMAFLPALLLCHRWKMRAEIVRGEGERHYFYLDDETQLKSDEKESPSLSSQEETFAYDFEEHPGEWKMIHSPDMVHLKELVFLPSFAFSHPSGRQGLLEIAGFWHPSSLIKKIEGLKRAHRRDIIIAVQREMNVMAEELKPLPEQTILFKKVLSPSEVLEKFETM
ncbi:MAG: DUF790 family protein [Candidatus Tectomicrobia bacterium]|nr:DUF790 family protein [Candidatus Tectomicrobia bacterium]